MKHQVFVGRPFVKRFALCYRSVVCLPVLSVTLVYCDQTIGRIKIKLRKQVGLGLGHIALDGEPSSPDKKDHIPPTFGPRLLSPNGWMHQDTILGTEVGLGPGDSVLDGDSAPLKGVHTPIFGPCLLWPNGCPSHILLSPCLSIC